MKHIDKLFAQRDVPPTRNFWLRFVQYFVGAFVIGYLLYLQLSQFDLDVLKSIDEQRSAIALLMLSIMSARKWGWFSFILIISIALWEDWKNSRWRSFPKEKSEENNDENLLTMEND